MALNSLQVKIIESSRVGPPPGTTPSHASLPFTFFDVRWMITPPFERLFFYPYCHTTLHFMTSLLLSLKHSLSLALETYYPLTGGFRRTPGTEDKLEHYYVEGDTVSFTVAKCDGPFEDLASDHKRDISQLDHLIPRLSKSKDDLQPLLAVQVTVFPEHGIVIGTTVHHAACDGTTSMQFIHAWAQACLSGAFVSSRVPFFDRSFISDPSNLYSSIIKIIKIIKRYYNFRKLFYSVTIGYVVKSLHYVLHATGCRLYDNSSF
ncbi:hypothetical protein LUZ61_000212 [Rhynchospora tenuis]|uniref:Uncharacterized protein n=1 Tax=Rhynchospora tenuis TaxID=198213 RepID=A0AAD6EPM3_9POAL|nr:hypothetical protein LUZ61_000212 [Rhynchospora tenuis]